LHALILNLTVFAVCSGAGAAAAAPEADGPAAAAAGNV